MKLYLSDDLIEDCTNDWMNFKKIFLAYWNVHVTFQEPILKSSKILLNFKHTLFESEMKVKIVNIKNGKYINYILFFNVFLPFLACGHGEILQSRALLYTQSDLLKSVEELKTQKQETEQPEDQDEVPIYFLFNIILYMKIS